MTRFGVFALKPDIPPAGIAQTMRSLAKAGGGRAETTTLADGMPLGIRPFSKSKLDELWGCGKLARGASDRCSVGTAASYSLQPNTYIGQPSQGFRCICGRVKQRNSAHPAKAVYASALCHRDFNEQLQRGQPSPNQNCRL
jgi:hypothetical protein